jgi:hypothetical protein
VSKTRSVFKKCCGSGSGIRCFWTPWIRTAENFSFVISLLGKYGGAGLAWAVTWQGSALVRLGVSLLDPTGTSWAEVPPPGPLHPLRHPPTDTSYVLCSRRVEATSRHLCGSPSSSCSHSVGLLATTQLQYTFLYYFPYDQF